MSFQRGGARSLQRDISLCGACDPASKSIAGVGLCLGGRIEAESSLQMAAVDVCQETLHAVDDEGAAQRREDLEGVLGTGNFGVADERSRALLERRIEMPRFGDRYQRVVLAMNDEKRRRIAMNPTHG